jgi:hypothetical protein
MRAALTAEEQTTAIELNTSEAERSGRTLRPVMLNVCSYLLK